MTGQAPASRSKANREDTVYVEISYAPDVSVSINSVSKRGKRDQFIRKLGILLAIGGAIWLAGIVAAQVIPAASETIESMRPGTGLWGGIIAGLISALAIGLGVGFSVRWAWGKVMARLN
jgi:hypothetical protein